MRKAAVARSVAGVHCLYHEATYDDAQAFKAAARGHSTAREAAAVAREAGAQHLVIGHYSKSITDESLLTKQAAEEFGGKITAAKEGLIFEP